MICLCMLDVAQNWQFESQHLPAVSYTRAVRLQEGCHNAIVQVLAGEMHANMLNTTFIHISSGVAF